MTFCGGAIGTGKDGVVANSVVSSLTLAYDLGRPFSKAGITIYIQASIYTFWLILCTEVLGL